MASDDEIEMQPIESAPVDYASLDSDASATEVASEVAESAAEVSAVDAGASLEVAEAAGEAAAAAVDAGLGVLSAIGSVASIVGIAAIPLVIAMQQPERVTMLIENRTQRTWSQVDLYQQHGKEVAYPVGRQVPPCTDKMSASEQVWHAIYGYSKHDGALVGTEGVLQLQSDDGAKLSIYWAVPESGSNGCGVAFDPSVSAESAYSQMDPNRARSASASGYGYQAKAIVNSTSGGDVGMIVVIEEA